MKMETKHRFSVRSQTVIEIESHKESFTCDAYTVYASHNECVCTCTAICLCEDQFQFQTILVGTFWESEDNSSLCLLPNALWNTFK